LDGYTVETNGGGPISDKTTDDVFAIDIQAVDQYGNVLDSGPNVFTGQVDITDTSGTLVQLSAAFVAGVVTENVQITVPQLGNVIEVVESGGVFGVDPSGTSNAFDVGPGALAAFIFTVEPTDPPNPVPLFAGTGIAVRIEARDAQGNLKTDYTESAAISDSTLTISEGAPNGGDQLISFSGGVYNNALNPTLYITGAQPGVVITVSAGPASTPSNAFEVQPGLLSYFTVEAGGGGLIGPKVATDPPFDILISAYDAYGNLLNSGTNIFDGAGATVDITDPAASLVPVTSGPFTNGQRIEFVSIPKAQTGITIQVTNSTGPETGVSNVFSVSPGPPAQYVFSGIPDPLTAGQSVAIRVEVQDAVGNIIPTYTDTANFIDIGPDTVIFVTDENAYTDSQITLTNGVWEGSIVTDTNPVSTPPPNINRPGNQAQLQLVPDTLPPPTAPPAIDTTPAFTVQPGAAHHFLFLTEPEPFERVDTIIEVDIIAVDQYDNPVLFNQQATIGDVTNTIYEGPPTGTGINDDQIQFTNVTTAPGAYNGYDVGYYTGNFLITTSNDNDVIVVSYATISGTSIAFVVSSNEVIVQLVADTAPKVAFEGDTIAMLDFSVTNPAPALSGENAEITDMEFFIENSENGIASTAVPDELIQSLRLYDVTGVPVLIAENLTPPSTAIPVPINIVPPSVVPENNGILQFRVEVVLRTDVSQAAVANIQIRIGDMDGIFQNTPLPGTPLFPTNGMFESILLPENYIRSGLTNIREEGQEAFNYPNPFSPKKQPTTLVYFSSSAGQSNIKIFTITGRLVRTITDNANPGSNEVDWDGKNGKGQIVRNGVYVAVIMPPGGSKQMVKIAVVK
jgi:hypothetical protein